MTYNVFGDVKLCSTQPECEVLKAKDLSWRTCQNIFRRNISTTALFLNHNYLSLYSLKTVTYRKNAKQKRKLRTWLPRPRPSSSRSRPHHLSSWIPEDISVQWWQHCMGCNICEHWAIQFLHPSRPSFVPFLAKCQDLSIVFPSCVWMSLTNSV